MSIENNNYNNFEDIPYLNNLESYNYYLKNAVIDLSNEETYDSLHKINKESNIYFDKGPPKSEPGVDDSSLNILLFDSYKVNNELIVEKSKNEIQFIKSISNRMKNIKNGYNNNRLVDQILNGNEASTGEIKNVEDEIIEKEHDIDRTNKKVEINEYFHKKRSHQIKVIKNCFYIVFFMFFTSVLNKFNIIERELFIGFIISGICIIVIYLIYESIDMYFRDNRNYDEYTFLNTHIDLGIDNIKKNMNKKLYLQDDIKKKCKKNNNNTTNDDTTNDDTTNDDTTNDMMNDDMMNVNTTNE